MVSEKYEIVEAIDIINHFKEEHDKWKKLAFDMEEDRDKYIEYFLAYKEENQSLKEKLSQYESGHKGACSTCEVVGELNVELEKRLGGAREVIEIYSKGVGSSSAIQWLNQNKKQGE